jgi:hypothetical protein
MERDGAAGEQEWRSVAEISDIDDTAPALIGNLS